MSTVTYRPRTALNSEFEKKWGWIFDSLFILGHTFARPFEAIRDIVYYLTKPKPLTTTELRDETQNLVDKLKPHKLAKDDPMHPTNYCISIMEKSVLGYGCSYNFLHAIAGMIFPIIDAERFLELPVPEPSQDIVQQAKYRDELREVINKHKNFIETKRAFETAIINSLKAFLDALPPAAFSDSGNTTILLEDIITNPQTLLMDMLAPFYATDVLQRKLFKSLTDQIDENIKKQKDVLPRDAQGTTTELFNRYLYNTPLRNITSAQIPFGIPDTIRPEHILLVAGTGSGKTQFIQQDIYTQLQKDERPGIVVINSQGQMLPKLERLNLWSDNLIIIDPEDINPPALNMFALPERIKNYDRNIKEQIEGKTIELFGFLFAALDQTLTGRQATFFSFVTRLVLSIPSATIRTLREVLEEEVPDKKPQQSKFWPYVEKLDEDAKAFFTQQFYAKGYNIETKRRIVQRLYGILRVPAFNRMFTAKDNKLDLFTELNAGKTILVNTSKSLLGNDASSVFRRYIIAQTLSAAFQRIAINPPYRPALLYIDESVDYFQDETLATLFAQARKYELGALTAFQNLDQLPAALRPVVVANTSTKLVSGLSDKDARSISSDMRTDADFIMSLKKRKDGSEWACFIKTYTPKAVRLFSPFGVVENAPKMSAEEHKALRQRNSERYGTHEAPAKKDVKEASTKVSPPHPTSVTTTPPPAQHPVADPHAGVDD